MDLDRALEIAREAAEAAAVVIRHHYRRNVSVETKADETPVTDADREAEAAIKRVLKRAFPDHAFYGEEFGREGDSDFLWLIDPIDGTKAFVRDYPMFSTQIALMHAARSSSAFPARRNLARRRGRARAAARSSTVSAFALPRPISSMRRRRFRSGMSRR